MEKLITIKKIKRRRKHGFLKRAASFAGQKMLRSRRTKGRKSLSI